MSIRNKAVILIAIIFFIIVLIFILNYLGVLEFPNTLLAKANTLNKSAKCSSNKWINYNNIITIAAVGDMNFARGVASHMDTAGFDSPLREVSNILASADIATGNLESPISNIGSPMDKIYVFRADTQNIATLESAGFDILTIANNHAFDYGLSAFCDCIKRFNSSNIQIVGGGKNLEEALRPKFIEANGIRVAFLAFNDTRTNYIGKDRPACAPAQDPFVFQAIADVRDLCDILIIQMHWGEEYALLPSDRQIALGRAMIDSGATVILGHHPHSWQAVEFYNGGLIAYSLGNFIFDQKDLFNNLSAIMFLQFEGVALKEVRLIPVELITAPKEARIAHKPLSDKFLAYLSEVSFTVSTDIIELDSNIIELRPILR